MRIDLFRMERMQSLHWHRVEYDLSESGVLPLKVGELLGDGLTPAAFLDTALGYPLSEGSDLLRERVAAFYPGASPENVTVVNGGSEANHLSLWSLLEPGDRLAVMLPNYMQAWGLGRHYTGRVDTFSLRAARAALGPRRGRAAQGGDEEDARRPRLQSQQSHRRRPRSGGDGRGGRRRPGASAPGSSRTRSTGEPSSRASALTPTFFGRYERVAVTGGLSKAFGLPGLRIGWVIAPPALIKKIWIRHDYTTLTPGMLSDRLAAVAMEPDRRDQILSRTREIVRRQWPRLEGWLRSHEDILEWAPPRAGAIALARYRLPVGSTALVDRIRREQSVLLVPGDMLGAGRSLRFGFGYDIERTLAGLARVDRVLTSRRPIA